ncbi:iron-containing redox enzyme family protein [uncultured Porticoccus sp.]|uniref:TenA family transcriptional regulator n=1 Tax=uncultured Porticoccus sp. TaxID=1256050 RepID=UPI0030DD4D24|tara:strand:- start:3993 stop:4685 length:693 start_codon:yes stop_codon:yes gene_type:complete
MNALTSPPFFDTLTTATDPDKSQLLTAPIIQRGLEGRINIEDYLGFLQQAYHHVKHTVPLLMAVGSRLPEEQEWLRLAVAEYIEEEVGHQEWILNDIAACGYDSDAVRRGQPNSATELMVAYAYDTVMRVNPVGFFGMVHVLEGTSVSIAETVADNVRGTLGLPQNAFSYLYSHGSLDKGHVAFFEGLMNRIESPQDQAQIIHSVRMFYRLYGDLFRSLDDVSHNIPRTA